MSLASVPKPAAVHLRSLRGYLQRNVMVLIAGALLLNAALVSLVVVLESREDLDEDLTMAAELVRLRTQMGTSGLPVLPMEVSYQVWDVRAGLKESSTDATRAPLVPLNSGFQNYRTHRGRMRAFVLPLHSGGWIVVASPFWHHLASRAGELAALMLLPALFVFPLLGALIGRIVAHASDAMSHAADQVAHRRGDNFQPLDDSSLPQEVQPLVQAFNRLLRRLSDSLDSERRFNDAAAHELRTPLASIRLDAQLLPHLQDPAERRATTRRIEAASINGSQLLEELLTIARLPEHGQDVAQATMSLARLVDLLEQEFAEPMERAAVVLRRDFDLQLELALPQVLHLILRNLISNALHHAHGLHEILIRAFVRDGVLELWVADDGPGVAPENRERVFERFTRLDRDRSGSGLGLYIVRRSAERFGGSVQLGEGLHGRGAGFLLRLPMSA